MVLRVHSIPKAISNMTSPFRMQGSECCRTHSDRRREILAFTQSSQMPTRLPRIPNVKLATNIPCSQFISALVQNIVPSVKPVSVSALNDTPKPRTLTIETPVKGNTIREPPSLATLAPTMNTRILSVDPQRLGNITFSETANDWISTWDIEYVNGENHDRLKRAAQELVNSDVPVAFPTETVYGLGADATRSSAVKAIFAAKGRPADNPLIVHFYSLPQLRALLLGEQEKNDTNSRHETDPIPAIYRPIIERFWPGPITIILPTPAQSILAPEVTAGLTTFGARMPRSILALSLLRLCGRPLAAPSANASTRPSPTAAEHVYDDLLGRISTIIDGGPCEVGVESTVVDGLSNPPSILRPGGITVEQLRQCPGWENVTIGYKDKQEGGISKPRAPGMKYRHYSPRAEVFLFEAGADKPHQSELEKKERVGIIRTSTWEPALGLSAEKTASSKVTNDQTTTNGLSPQHQPAFPPETPTGSSLSRSNLLRSVIQHQIPHAEQYSLAASDTQIWDIHLGAHTEDVARGIFSALRELDKKDVQTIYVEGIDDKSGDDIAAAVMNRLRKAAEVRG